MTPNDRPVLFMDSGIGGIPYCRYFCERNPSRRVVYLADRANFPYGAHSREELIAITNGLVERAAAALCPQVVVLACNTATVSALAALRARFPELSFVGTVPALKPAIRASATGKVGVLGTERTIEDSYIRELALQNGAAEICGIAAPELVEFVERRFDTATEREKMAQARRWLEPFATGVDAVALGCTHFLFLLDEFRRAAAPGIQIFESRAGVSRRIETLIASGGANGGYAAGGSAAGGSAAGGGEKNMILLTGSVPPEESWRRWAAEMGFSLSVLEEPCGA